MTHTPTPALRERVESYSAVGIPQDDIARVLGIDPKTLRKHYRDELDLGSIKANATIGGAMFNKAKAGDSTLMIWWSKCRMGWKEDKAEIPDDEPPPVTSIRFVEQDARLPDD